MSDDNSVDWKKESLQVPDTGPHRGHGMPAETSRQAPHIGHSNHLCDLADRGQISSEQMKALVRNPQYICRKCGRIAHNADNLCEPVPLEETPPTTATTPQS